MRALHLAQSVLVLRVEGRVVIVRAVDQAVVLPEGLAHLYQREGRGKVRAREGKGVTREPREGERQGGRWCCHTAASLTSSTSPSAETLLRSRSRHVDGSFWVLTMYQDSSCALAARSREKVREKV